MALDLPDAPEFPQGFTWLNTERPLRMKEELRGRVIILDFWTYCCINCIHVLPDLEYLEEKYKDEPVAIIGVHSNKYTNEADPVNIREAILRHDITHPVIVDENHVIWDTYGVHAWPTLVVIDSNGLVIGTLSGEGHRDELDRIIAALLEIGREQRTLATTPLPLRRETPHHWVSGYSYPEKIVADPPNRLFIADTHNNRVLMTDWNGEILGFFGDGAPGLRDGNYEDARFHHPHGMLLIGSLLYVADTDNHAIRRIDLSGYHVDTILGNGSVGYDRRGGRKGREQALNSPWDIAFLDGKLYISMAGLHQIWALDLATMEARVAIGTGRENITDNVARKAALAQTSGMAADHGMLYFADSETSAVRRYDPRTDQVSTLVGQGLFTFGDVDGQASEALLQHPLDVDVQGADLYVADTYNHKIRHIDLRTGDVTTVVGSGTPGRLEGETLLLYEPGGISVVGRDLFIADTNNDRVIHYMLDSKRWREVIPKVGGEPLVRAA